MKIPERVAKRAFCSLTSCWIAQGAAWSIRGKGDEIPWTQEKHVPTEHEDASLNELLPILGGSDLRCGQDGRLES